MSRAIVPVGIGCLVLSLAACGGGNGGGDAGQNGNDGAVTDAAGHDAGGTQDVFCCGWTDSGTVRDGGNPPSDSGSPPTDSGSPPTDSGSPPTDSGTGCGPRTTFLDGYTPARTLYASPSGNDSNDGLTPATAWRTLANASRLQPGDRLDVSAGDYTCGGNITVHGTAAAPIWIRSVDGPGRAVFDCAATGGFLVTESQYLAFDGFEFKNAPNGHMFNVFSNTTPPFTPVSDHVLFIRNHIHDTQQAGIKSSQSTNIWVIDNEIDHAEAYGTSVGGQAIDFVGNNYGLIAGNRIHDVPTNIAVQVKGGETETVIDGNQIYTVMTAIHLGGSTGPQYFVPQDSDHEAERAVAMNNRIWDANRVGIAAWGCHDCLIANNTVVLASSAAQAVRGLPGATGQDYTGGTTSYVVNLRLINNLFYLQPSVQDVLNFAAGNDTGFTQSNNLWFRTSGAVSALYSDVPVGGTGTILDQDPRLANPNSGDLSLGTGSPAIGAGTPLAEVTRDGTGACRTSWNIGAL